MRGYLQRVEGSLYDVIDAACRGWQPLLKQRLRLWVPRLSTSLLHWVQGCGSHKGAPRQRPKVMWMTSLSIHNPKEVTGGACSQAI